MSTNNKLFLVCFAGFILCSSAAVLLAPWMMQPGTLRILFGAAVGMAVTLAIAAKVVRPAN